MKHNCKSIACLLAAVCTALPLLGACTGDPTPKEQPTDTASVAQSDTLPADGTPTGTETMVEAIRGLGGEKLIYTPFDGMNHDIWENAYATEGLIPWLFSQKLSDRK